jgi:hypothetical protein
VDGGQNIANTDNISYQNDMGLEVGAENHGYVASGIVVADNVLYNNTQGGIVFGGYAAGRGRVQNCSFISNTIYNSDTGSTGQGQLMIQFASNNLVANNIFVASANDVLIGSSGRASNVNNTLDHNLYFARDGAGKAKFRWNGQTFSSYSAYERATGEDAHSPFGDPAFVDAAAANFHLMSTSLAIDAGGSTPGSFAPTDFDGNTRDLPPEIGAYEFAANGTNSRGLQMLGILASASASKAHDTWKADHFITTETLAELCLAGGKSLEARREEK